MAMFECVHAPLKSRIALERVGGEAAWSAIIVVPTATRGNRLSVPRLVLVDSMGAKKATSA
jgi:hypothetical protein